MSADDQVQLAPVPMPSYLPSQISFPQSQRVVFLSCTAAGAIIAFFEMVNMCLEQFSPFSNAGNIQNLFCGIVVCSSGIIGLALINETDRCARISVLLFMLFASVFSLDVIVIGSIELYVISSRSYYRHSRTSNKLGEQKFEMAVNIITIIMSAFVLVSSMFINALQCKVICCQPPAPTVVHVTTEDIEKARAANSTNPFGVRFQTKIFTESTPDELGFIKSRKIVYASLLISSAIIEIFTYIELGLSAKYSSMFWDNGRTIAILVFCLIIAVYAGLGILSFFKNTLCVRVLVCIMALLSIALSSTIIALASISISNATRDLHYNFRGHGQNIKSVLRFLSFANICALIYGIYSAGVSMFIAMLSYRTLCCGPAPAIFINEDTGEEVN